MEIKIVTWIQDNLLYLILLPANLLAVEVVIKSAAEAHGYKKTANTLDKVGNFISFLADIINGLTAKKNTVQPIPTPLSGQKVD